MDDNYELTKTNIINLYREAIEKSKDKKQIDKAGLFGLFRNITKLLIQREKTKQIFLLKNIDEEIETQYYIKDPNKFIKHFFENDNKDDERFTYFYNSITKPIDNNVLTTIFNNRVHPLFRKIVYELFNPEFALDNIISEDTDIASGIKFRNLFDDFKLIHTDKIRKTLKDMNLNISEKDLIYIETTTKAAVGACYEVHKGITKTLNIQQGFRNMITLCGNKLNPREPNKEIIEKFKQHLLDGVNFYLDNPNEIYEMYQEEMKGIDINRIKEGLKLLIHHYMYGEGESLSDAFTNSYNMGDHLGFDLHKYVNTVFTRQQLTIKTILNAINNYLDIILHKYTGKFSRIGKHIHCAYCMTYIEMAVGGYMFPTLGSYLKRYNENNRILTERGQGFKTGCWAGNSDRICLAISPSIERSFNRIRDDKLLNERAKMSTMVLFNNPNDVISEDNLFIKRIELPIVQIDEDKIDNLLKNVNSELSNNDITITDREHNKTLIKLLEKKLLSRGHILKITKKYIFPHYKEEFNNAKSLYNQTLKISDTDNIPIKVTVWKFISGMSRYFSRPDTVKTIKGFETYLISKYDEYRKNHNISKDEYLILMSCGIYAPGSQDPIHDSTGKGQFLSVLTDFIVEDEQNGGYKKSKTLKYISRIKRAKSKKSKYLVEYFK